MIFHRLGLINKNRLGFTLIEVIVAVAISGIITAGITGAIFQVFSQNTRSTAHMTAVKQVENAVHWISRDAQMAQSVVTGDDPETDLLILTWTEWDNTVNQVTYTIVDGELKRNHLSVNPEEPSETVEMVVARYINPDPEMTNCKFLGGVLTFEVTAGSEIASETRVCEVIPRPSL